MDNSHNPEGYIKMIKWVKEQGYSLRTAKGLVDAFLNNTRNEGWMQRQRSTTAIINIADQMMNAALNKDNTEFNALKHRLTVQMEMMK